MAMTIDPQQRQLAAVGGFDHMPYSSSGHQFPGSWASASPRPVHLFPSSSNATLEALAKQQIARSSNISLPYASAPANSSSVGAPSAYGTYTHQDLLNLPPSYQNSMRPGGYDHGYSAAPVSSVEAYAPVSAPYLGVYGSISPQQHQTHTRRSSQQSTSSTSQSQSSFGDAVDAGRGMGEMSQDLTTPRNIYGSRADRESIDSYGFPASHSPHSSISSASQYPSYYNSSVDSSSVSDYGSQSDSLESINSRTRTLPPPTGMISGGLPPAPPSSMMGQFNSKISTSTQKKHKCKMCDKRFTRPSSLQTHVYSHTGEKPYACEAEGCGRHFSVVSNLRRHRKVHRCNQSPGKDSP